MLSKNQDKNFTVRFDNYAICVHGDRCGATVPAVHFAPKNNPPDCFLYGAHPLRVRISGFAHTRKKKKDTQRVSFSFGDPPEIRQGCALSICFANIRLYVPFADAKDGQWVRISETIKKEQPDCVGLFLFGDPPEIRTPDTLIKSQVLCQLS